MYRGKVDHKKNSTKPTVNIHNIATVNIHNIATVNIHTSSYFWLYLY